MVDIHSIRLLNNAMPRGLTVQASMDTEWLDTAIRISIGDFVRFIFASGDNSRR
jgi:hypothetical protein